VSQELLTSLLVIVVLMDTLHIKVIMMIMVKLVTTIMKVSIATNVNVMDLDPQVQVAMPKENVLVTLMFLVISAINVVLVCSDFPTVKIVPAMLKDLLMELVKTIAENATVKITLLVTNALNV